MVRNPMRPHQVSKVLLDPQHVEGIVFWTKNPAPMLPYLERFATYPYYFQYTLTSYGKEMEPGVPQKAGEGITTFQKLSDHIGSERVIWRYDPILLSPHYSLSYHLRYFEQIARRLEGYTKVCVISFLDEYPAIERQMHRLEVRGVLPSEMQSLAQQMAQIAAAHQMRIATCAEQIDLQAYGIHHGRCVDAKLLSKLAGKPVKARKDPAQRLACGCAASVDLGAYGACYGGCKYCYARGGSRAAQHQPGSPFLLGEACEGDIVRERI